MKKHIFEFILAIKNRCLETEEMIQKELGLSHAEFNGLLCIQPKEELSASDFAKRMGLSPSRGSRVLWKLVSQKFVTTNTNDEDRRIIDLTLSKKGKEMRRKIAQRMKRCEEKIVSNISITEKRQIKKSLSRLEELL